VARAQVKPHLDVDYGDMTYRPVVWFNEFWLLRDKLVPLNGSVAEVPLQLSVYPLALWKFTIYQQMEQSFNMQARPSLARRGPVFGAGHRQCGRAARIWRGPQCRRCGASFPVMRGARPPPRGAA